jgi:hypothetical protein
VNKAICLLLLSLVVANAAELETWSCRGTAASGLYWQNGQWQSGEFATRTYRLELQDLQVSISENNDPALVVMDCKANTWSWSCSNDAASLEFNKESTKAVLIRFFGAIFPKADSAQKDSIYIETLSCTKF